MVCFLAGYILPNHRKLTLYALNEALIRGPFTSAEKTADPRSTATAVRTTLVVCHCCFIVADAPAQDQKTEPKPKLRFLAQNRTETDRP